jgi:hypothetical protein
MFVNCVLCEFASFSASNIQSLYINITYFITYCDGNEKGNFVSWNLLLTKKIRHEEDFILLVFH